MSDPVTNVEIEDVVSSIRRLFSEDKRLDSDSEESTEKQGDLASPESVDPSDRLVLTSAFRIDQSEMNSGSEALDPKVESTATADESDLDSVDNSEEEDGHRLHLISEPEEETSEAEDKDVLVLGEWHSSAEVSAVSKSKNEPSPALDQPSDAIIASQSRQNSLETTIAELEAAISDQGNKFEPDGSEEVGSIPENEPLQWTDADADMALGSETEESVQDKEVIELDNSAPQDVDPAFVRRHATPSEDDEVNEENAPFEDAESAELQAALDQDAPTLEDLPLDEHALRDLVSEIVRQELQGALGERITRNVRKLVRREIHRIISSQDMD